MDDASQAADASCHEDGPDTSFGGGAGPIRRACDNCRSRKIRCNRESPCSHCIHARIECTHADVRPKEKRTRILITPQYERKIDQIDRRLDGVVRLLEDLKVNMPSSASRPNNTRAPPAQNSTTGTPGRGTPSMSTPSSHAMSSECITGAVVEGDSSLSAHSEFANEFLRKVVGNDSLQNTSAEMRETLDALSHIVTSLKQQTIANEMCYPNARVVQRPRLTGHEMPPIQKTVAVTRAARDSYLAGAAFIYEFLPTQKFPDLCLNVYFADDYSEAEFIIVNAGLHSLFSDFACQVPDLAEEEKEENMKYARMCGANLETHLSALPLHAPATSDMILALIFGSYYAVEISKPSLAWILLSKASELAQTLGLHRLTPPKETAFDEDFEYKQHLFWFVYFLDKSLCLRLGRASSIQDWDITVPEPDPMNSKRSAWVHYFVLWIGAARCQGDIYEQLYSPSALSQTDHVRHSRVQRLVSVLEDLHNRTETTNRKWAKEAKEFVGENLMRFFWVSDDVLRLSLLTLVYRAAPRPANSTTTFGADCIKAARATLERHQDCIVILRESADAFFPTYMNWTLLFSPFIPFIVIFCQVIETQDQDDLARMHAFITSIQKAPGVSEAAGKMHKLFQVLYTVALRYVELRTSKSLTGGAQGGGEMDTYLASLGLPGPTPASMSASGNDGMQQQQQQQAQQQLHGGVPQPPTQQTQQQHQQQMPLHPQQQQQQQQTPQQQHMPTPQDSLGRSAGSVLGSVAGDGSLGAEGINQMMWMGNGAQLEDWFYNNQAMMDLLQEPNFNFPNPNMGESN